LSQIHDYVSIEKSGDYSFQETGTARARDYD